MIKLLKYDWKRNANTLIAAAVILIVAQALLLAAAYKNGWGTEGAYVSATVLHAFGSLLSIIMICQTYSANIKAYSRRLLPLPSLYAVAPPMILLLGCHIVLLLTFLASDYAISSIFDTEGMLLASVPIDITAAGYLNLAVGVLLTLFSICTVLFFSITAAATVQGKAGVWFGMAVFAIAVTVLTWLDSLLFPDKGQSPYFGYSVIEQTEGIAISVTGLRSFEWLSMLYELAIAIALLYGIRYMLARLIKL